MAVPPEPFFDFYWKGPKPAKYNEAPLLAQLVQAGLLPPVEERLPDEPLVLDVYEEIGQYGGTWRRAFLGPSDDENINRLQHDQIIATHPDGMTLAPNIAKDWKSENGFREFTIYLRKGMKWSDGHPFTADDILWAYEYDLTSLDVNKGRRNADPFLDPVTGKFARLEKVDDYTFRFVFDNPSPRFFEFYAGRAHDQGVTGKRGGAYFRPAHYMKQFHPDFADAGDVDAMVKENGLENWPQLFLLKGNPHLNSEIPRISPWIMTNPLNTPVFRLERNPYYFAVDREGNQLPYISEIVMTEASNLEVLNLRAVAGEIDMQARHIDLGAIPLLMENRERGNFRIILMNWYGSAQAGLTFNQSWEGDPEVQNLIRDDKFRKALSMASDRGMINDIIFAGLGQPSLGLPAKASPYYDESWDQDYVEALMVRNVEEANRLLDEIGLTKKDSSGFRLRKDGGKLVLPVQYMEDFTNFGGVGEVLQTNWRDIGIDITLQQLARAAWSDHRDTNQLGINIGPFGTDNGRGEVFSGCGPGCGSWMPGPEYSHWKESGGERGTEPTDQDILRLYELFATYGNLPLEDRIEGGQEFIEINFDRLWGFGLVGDSPARRGVFVINNSFRNVIPDAVVAARAPGVMRPDTWFFKQN